MSGEGHAHGLAVLRRGAGRRARGQGHPAPRGRPVCRRRRRADTALRFPGKAALLPDGSVAGRRHRAPPGRPAGARPRDRARRRGRRTAAGSGVRRAAGRAACCPRRGRAGRLRPGGGRHGQPPARGISLLGRRHPASLAGTGEPLRAGDGQRARARAGPLDAVGRGLVGDRVVVAMAGIHQLWALTRSRPGARPVEVLGGHDQEGLRDGPATTAWLAQPSGLAASGRRRRLWVADAETSALRTWSDDGLVGTAGRHGAVRLRPPRRPGRRGAAAAPARRHRAAGRLGRGLRHLQRRGPPVRPGDQPGDDAGRPGWPSRATRWSSGRRRDARLVVVESAAHRLVRVAMPADAQEVDGPARQTQRPPTTIALGRRSSWWSRSSRPAARSSTTVGATRPGWSSRPARPSSFSPAPGTARA